MAIPIGPDASVASQGPAESIPEEKFQPGQETRKNGTFIPAGYKTRLSALMAVIRFGPELFATITEFMAFLWHVERSLCYGKASDASSWSQITGGVYSRKHQTWIRGAAGVGKRAFQEANTDLEKLGLLRRSRRCSEKRGNEATEYEVLWENVSQYFAEKLGQKTPPPSAPRSQGGSAPGSQAPSAPRSQEQS